MPLRTKRNTQRRKVGLAAVLFLIASVLYTPIAHSTVRSCVGAATELYDGFVFTNAITNVTGTSGYIWTAPADLCTGTNHTATHFSMAWMMLTTTDGSSYAQLGYIFNYDTNGLRSVYPRHFAQYHSAVIGGYPTWFSGTIGYGIQETYRILYNKSSLLVDFQVNGSLWVWGNGGIFNDWQSKPRTVQFLGSAAYAQDDVPGTTYLSQYASYRALGLQQAYTGSAMPYGPIVQNPCGMTKTLGSVNWNAYGNACDSFDIWSN